MSSNKKRILIFIDWFLPGTKSGGPVRSYTNLIQNFEKDYEFLVITRDTDYCETIPYKNIAINSWNKLNENTKVYYFSKDKLNKKNISKVISETQYDIAYINGIYSWFFSILPLILLRKEKIKKIVAARGMLNPQAFSVKKTQKQLFLFFAKKTSLYKKVIFHATNNDEKTYIKNVISNTNTILVAPNLPRKIQEIDLNNRVKGKVIKMISLARISKEKGILNVLKAISKIQNNSIILDLYGPIYDKDYWGLCKEVISNLPLNIEVNYKGSVDGDNIPNVIKKYHFFILLSEGENFGHAILEALSAGCPVIISDMTPWKNLASINVGWDLPLKNEVEIIKSIEFACNMSQKKYDHWSESAYKFAKEFCNNPEVIEANKRLFE